MSCLLSCGKRQGRTSLDTDDGPGHSGPKGQEGNDMSHNETDECKTADSYLKWAGLHSRS